VCRSLRGSRRLGLLLALVLSVGATACGAEQQHSQDTPPTVPDGNVSRLLSTNFELLRTPPDGIPANVRRTLQVPVPGMNWNLARRVPVSLPGTYWLAPGVGDLCIVATSPGSPAVGTVCASADQALRHGIANASIDPASGRRVIVGVAPNGSRTVLVRTGASTASARVRRHGSFVLRDSASSPPDTLTLR
jgi:hypothetical protein